MQSQQRHSSTMSRRNNPAMNALVMAGVLGFLVFAVYTYHKTNTELSRKTKSVERLTQEHDSLSAQLQVVYEHKSRLETQLKEEMDKGSALKKELTQQIKETQAKYGVEKESLQDRIKSISQENRLLEARNDDLQQEYGKLQTEFDKVVEDNKAVLEQNQQEFLQAKQQCENDMAKLKDEVANLERRNSELQLNAEAAQRVSVDKQQQAAQNEQKLQEQNQQQLQIRQQQQQNIRSQQDQNQQNIDPLQQNAAQQQKVQQNVLPQQQEVQQNLAHQQNGLQQQNDGQLKFQQQKNVPLQNGGADDHHMQIQQPGDEQAAYFKPKPAKNEGEVVLEPKENEEEHDPAQQVIPPHVDGNQDKLDAREQENNLQQFNQLDAPLHKEVEDDNLNLKLPQRHQDQEGGNAPIGGIQQGRQQVNALLNPHNPPTEATDGDEQNQDVMRRNAFQQVAPPVNGNANSQDQAPAGNFLGQNFNQQKQIDTDMKAPEKNENIKEINIGADFRGQAKAGGNFQGPGPDGNLPEDGLAGDGKYPDRIGNFQEEEQIGRRRRSDNREQDRNPGEQFGRLHRQDEREQNEDGSDQFGQLRRQDREHDNDLREKLRQLRRENVREQEMDPREQFGRLQRHDDREQEKDVAGPLMNFARQNNDLQPGEGRKEMAAPQGHDGGMLQMQMEAPDEKEEDEEDDELADKNKHYYDDADENNQYQEDQEDEDEHHNQENDAAR